jgi:hypothetical protein
LTRTVRQPDWAPRCVGLISRRCGRPRWRRVSRSSVPILWCLSEFQSHFQDILRVGGHFGPSGEQLNLDERIPLWKGKRALRHVVRPHPNECPRQAAFSVSGRAAGRSGQDAATVQLGSWWPSASGSWRSTRIRRLRPVDSTGCSPPVAGVRRPSPRRSSPAGHCRARGWPEPPRNLLGCGGSRSRRVSRPSSSFILCSGEFRIRFQDILRVTGPFPTISKRADLDHRVTFGNRKRTLLRYARQNPGLPSRHALR